MASSVSSFRDKALKHLPPKSRELLDQLEITSARSIEFVLDPGGKSSALASVKYPNNLKNATIIFRGEDEHLGQSMTHELLHLKRWWLDSVPQLLCDSIPDAIANADNILEHVAIVPTECEFVDNGAKFWNDVYRRDWEAADLTKRDAGDALKESLLGWLATSFLTDKSVIQLVEQRITSVGYFEKARAFKAEALPLIEKNKARAAACLFWHLGISETELFYLRTYDAVAGTHCDNALPPCKGRS